MDNEALKDKLNGMIAAQLGIPAEEIRRGYGGYGHTLADLGADEYDIVSLIMALDGEFGISISDEDAQTLDTPSAIYEYMLKQTRE